MSKITELYSDVIAVAGTGRGADTAAVIRQIPQINFLTLN